MELQLVSLEQAKKLKELGFKWGVFHGYYHEDDVIIKSVLAVNPNNDDDYISVPYVALALKWFRDVKGVYISIKGDVTKFGIHYEIDFLGMFFKSPKYNSYELAESALLDALIEYVEEQYEK